MVSINTSLLLIIGAIAINPINQILAQTMDTIQISEWYGYSHDAHLATLEPTVTSSYINKISVGVNTGINIDIGGMEAYFTDNTHLRFESGSAQNDFSSFTVNDGECISKVLLTHNSNCCPHSLQFETTDSQLSQVWGSSIGARVIINYGHDYCLSKIDIMHVTFRGQIQALRFHFIQNTPNPSAAPTNAPSKSPTISPTPTPSEAPTNSPIAIPTINPTLTPTATSKAPTEAPTPAPIPAPTYNPTIDLSFLEPTRYPIAPIQAPTTGLIAVPTANPTPAPTETQLQGPNTVVLSLPGGTAIYTLVNCKYAAWWFSNADIDVTGEIESVGPDAAGAVGDMVTFSAAATISGSKVTEFGTMTAMRVYSTSGTIIVAHQAFTIASSDDNEPSSGETSKYPTAAPTPAPTVSTKFPTN